MIDFGKTAAKIKEVNDQFVTMQVEIKAINANVTEWKRGIEKVTDQCRESVSGFEAELGNVKSDLKVQSASLSRFEARMDRIEDKIDSLTDSLSQVKAIAQLVASRHDAGFDTAPSKTLPDGSK